MKKHPGYPARQRAAAAQSRSLHAQALNERAIALGTYIVEHAATVRSAAKAFGISKSTVHKDISTKLPQLHQGLSQQVQQVIEKNKEERHIRGGLATKQKYASRRKTPSTGARGQSRA